MHPHPSPCPPEVSATSTGGSRRRDRTSVLTLASAGLALVVLLAACEPVEPVPVDPPARGQPGPAIASFTGVVLSIAGNNDAYVFEGPSAPVEVTATSTRLTGVATAQLGLGPGSTPQLADVGMCWQPAEGGTIQNFVDGYFSQAAFTTSRASYSASATVVLPPGTYFEGMCVHNGGTRPITNNNYVNGWVMVTP